MLNVLDLRTYAYSDSVPKKNQHELWKKKDVNLIPPMERFEMAHARGRCWDLLNWFFYTYELFDRESGKPIEGFNKVSMDYLAHQASTIIKLKYKAWKWRIDGTEHFSTDSLITQMKLCFKDSNIDLPEISFSAPEAQLSLAFPDAEKYGVRKHRTPMNFGCKSCILRARFLCLGLSILAHPDLLGLGTTAADQLYFDYLKKV